MKTPLPLSLFSSIVLLAACHGHGHDHNLCNVVPPEVSEETREMLEEDEVLATTGAYDDGKSDMPIPVVLRRIAKTKLLAPTGLAFNPRVPGQLWIVNSANDSMVIIRNATSSAKKVIEKRTDGYATHFMANPMGIAFGGDWTSFGVPGTFATCGESRNTYSGQAAPNDFMGPTLWSSDLSIFANTNPYGLGSHIDMLHETPNCMGITHESDNVYWVIGGLQSAIYRYDFQVDHDIGLDDHADGVVSQWVTGRVSTVPGVPSHLAYDSDDLFVADTGNARIVRLDTRSGTRGGALSALEPLVDAYRVNNATLTEVVSESSGLLTAPSGIALHGDEIWVSDNATGRISAFSRTGQRQKYIDTGLAQGALAGITFGPDNRLYIVDMVANQVIRVEF